MTTQQLGAIHDVKRVLSGVDVITDEDAVAIHRFIDSLRPTIRQTKHSLAAEHAQSAEGRTLTVKLVLDTTEFDAAVERVKAALADLARTPLPVDVVPDHACVPCGVDHCIRCLGHHGDHEDAFEREERIRGRAD